MCDYVCLELVVSVAVEAERNKHGSPETRESNLALPDYAPSQAMLQVSGKLSLGFSSVGLLQSTFLQTENLHSLHFIPSGKLKLLVNLVNDKCPH